MEEARQLIAALQQLNSSDDRNIARFTPALVGMIGSAEMFNVLLADFDAALVSGRVRESLRQRARNLAGTFIPQVAALNSIDNVGSYAVSPQELQDIHAGTPRDRMNGVRAILGALMKILHEVNSIPGG